MSKCFSPLSSDDPNLSKKANFESTNAQNPSVDIVDSDTDNVHLKAPINFSECPTTETASRSKIEGTITLENIMGELKTLQGILNVDKSEQKQKLDEISEKIEKMSLYPNKFYNKEDKNEPLEDNVLMERIRQLISCNKHLYMSCPPCVCMSVCVSVYVLRCWEIV